MGDTYSYNVRFTSVPEREQKTFFQFVKVAPSCCAYIAQLIFYACMRASVLPDRKSKCECVCGYELGKYDEQYVEESCSLDRSSRGKKTTNQHWTNAADNPFFSSVLTNYRKCGTAFNIHLRTVKALKTPIKFKWTYLRLHFTFVYLMFITWDHFRLPSNSINRTHFARAFESYTTFDLHESRTEFE